MPSLSLLIKREDLGQRQRRKQVNTLKPRFKLILKAELNRMANTQIMCILMFYRK